MGRSIPLLAGGYVVMTLLVALLPSGSSDLGPPGRNAVAGAEVWRAANCIACHSIYGLGGHIGPDLANAISRLGTEGVTQRLFAGGGRMPRFAFSEAAAADLVAWLTYVDATGVYPLPRHFSPGYGEIR